MLPKVAALTLIAACASASDLRDPTRPPDSYASGPEPSKVVETSQLKLSFTRISKNGAFARIKGDSVSEGDTVAGRPVIAIKPGRVVLGGEERCAITMTQQIKGGGDRLPPCRAAVRVESKAASSPPERRKSSQIQSRQIQARQSQSAGDSAIKSYCAGIFDSYRLQENCIERERESRTEYKRSSFDGGVRSYCNRIFDGWRLRVNCAQRESKAKARLGG